MARRNRNLLIAFLLLVVAGATAALTLRAPREKPVLGLFTTLPIYWGEAAELGEMLSGESGTHWARQAFERDYVLRPLDVLGGKGRGDPLAEMRDLVLAQPRALSAAENVALDDWVRRGGRVLLFADPMLTAHSHFSIGDRRRPQDVVLLSPILRHWGLQLQFDDAQAAGEREVALFGVPVPVDLPGRFGLQRDEPGAGACRLHAGGLLAECAIGRGRALILADAAVLDGEGADHDVREAALSALMRRAFPDA